VYYVHSYAFHEVNSPFVLATTTYGTPFAAAVGSGSFVGVQFHPEKSQAVGLRLLRNFLSWMP
jgi:glutamine amidotransferase